MKRVVHQDVATADCLCCKNKWGGGGVITLLWNVWLVMKRIVMYRGRAGFEGRLAGRDCRWGFRWYVYTIEGKNEMGSKGRTKFGIEGKKRCCFKGKNDTKGRQYG